MSSHHFDGIYHANIVKLLGLVFDEVWEAVAGRYGTPIAIEAARIKLADIILGLAPTDDILDAERIKYGALVAMRHQEPAADSLNRARADVARETRFDALRRLAD